MKGAGAKYTMAELVADTRIKRANLLVGLTYPFVTLKHKTTALPTGPKTPKSSSGEHRSVPPAHPSATAHDSAGDAHQGPTAAAQAPCPLCYRYKDCFDAATYRGLAMLVADYLMGCADRQANCFSVDGVIYAIDNNAGSLGVGFENKLKDNRR
jgi:hypothetical protein